MPFINSNSCRVSHCFTTTTPCILRLVAMETTAVQNNAGTKAAAASVSMVSVNLRMMLSADDLCGLLTSLSVCFLFKHVAKSKWTLCPHPQSPSCLVSQFQGREMVTLQRSLRSLKSFLLCFNNNFRVFAMFVFIAQLKLIYLSIFYLSLSQQRSVSPPEVNSWEHGGSLRLAFRNSQKYLDFLFQERI